MLYLVVEEDQAYDKLEIAIDILDDICSSTLPCYVMLSEDIRMKDNRQVRGRYTLCGMPTIKGIEDRGIILIDKNCNFVEKCTVLVHEYSHHLTQENHGVKLFNLFKNWLRKEFVERWEEYVGGEKDKRPYRNRIVLVGKVCDDGKDKCLQK